MTTTNINHVMFFWTNMQIQTLTKKVAFVFWNVAEQMMVQSRAFYLAWRFEFDFLRVTDFLSKYKHRTYMSEFCIP